MEHTKLCRADIAIIGLDVAFCRNLRSIFRPDLLTSVSKNDIVFCKGDGLMLKQKIKTLKLKLENQILSNCSYDEIYNTSAEIDKLLVEYYKKYGLTKKS